MDEEGEAGEEPEPTPQTEAATATAADGTALLSKQVELELKAHYQYFQLAADLAQVRCPLACSAAFFLRLAEKTRSDAGTVMDLLLRQGGVLQLPGIARPCTNLAIESSGDATLTAALEACLQIEDSKERATFLRLARESGDVELEQLAEALLLEHRRLRHFLSRHLAICTRLREDGSSLVYASRLCV
jgi:ferritin